MSQLEEFFKELEERSPIGIKGALAIEVAENNSRDLTRWKPFVEYAGPMTISVKNERFMQKAYTFSASSSDILGSTMSFTAKFLTNESNYWVSGLNSFNYQAQAGPYSGPRLGLSGNIAGHTANAFLFIPAESHEYLLGQGPVLGKLIRDTDLLPRIKNCLISVGIETVGDLTKARGDDLLKVRSFGKLSLQEVNNLLKSQGLRSI